MVVVPFVSILFEYFVVVDALFLPLLLLLFLFLLLLLRLLLRLFSLVDFIYPLRASAHLTGRKQFLVMSY